MVHEQMIARYRHWYRKLLRLYPVAHRERFAESMEQTFCDLCHARRDAGGSLPAFVLWLFAETFAEIFKQNARLFFMQNKQLIRIGIVTGCLLLIPLLGNMFVEGWNWGLLDFVVWGGIVFGAGLTYELIAKKGSSTAYRVAVGIACLTGFLLVWVNAAVGIIGDEDLANAMYFAVLIIGFAGACLAHFEARGMSRALFTAAAAQAMVPLIAMLWVAEENFAPGRLPVMGLNAMFVGLWVASALLFRHAGKPVQQISV